MYNISQALTFIREQKRFNKTNSNLSYLISDSVTNKYKGRQIFTFIFLYIYLQIQNFYQTLEGSVTTDYKYSSYLVPDTTPGSAADIFYRSMINERQPPLLDDKYP